MSAFVAALQGAFDVLTGNSIAGMPLFMWFLLPLIFAIVVNFLRGKKE